jgi:hypothetical protein
VIELECYNGLVGFEFYGSVTFGFIGRVAMATISIQSAAGFASARSVYDDGSFGQNVNHRQLRVLCS